MRIIVCSIIFQVCWFALVWSAGKTVALPVLVGCTLVSVGQLAVYAKPLKLSILFVLVGAVIGGIMDTLLTALGVHELARAVTPSPFVPVWMLGLWLIFAVYIRTGLIGLRGKHLTQFAAGFFLGPMAWLAGSRMGAVHVNSNFLHGYGILAGFWGIICLVLFKASDLMRADNV